MPKTKLIGAMTFCTFAALLSCDNAQSPTNGGLSDNDCPVGTFRPIGLADCVFPADDQFGNPLGVSDNRCVSGQPALPPVCVSMIGGRSYFALTKSACAPDYRFEPGACQRNNGGGGFGGFFGTTGAAGVTGVAGAIVGEAGTGFGTGSGTGAAAAGGDTADTGI